MPCNACGKCCEHITFGGDTKKDFKQQLIDAKWNGCKVDPEDITEWDPMFIITQMIEVTTKDDHYFLCPFYDEKLHMCLIQQIPIGKPKVCANYPWYHFDKLDINNLSEGCGFEVEAENAAK